MIAQYTAHAQLKSVYGVSRVTCHHESGPPLTRGPGVEVTRIHVCTQFWWGKFSGCAEFLSLLCAKQPTILHTVHTYIAAGDKKMKLMSLHLGVLLYRLNTG